MPTTVIKSIGTSSRDYSTLQAWEDDGPADLTRSRASTTQAGSTSSTIVLDSGASGTDDYYKHLPVWCDARSSEKRLITAYNGTTKTATIGALNGSSATWANTPGTEAYTIDSAIWKGECYNDSEFYSSSGHVLTISGHTTDSTRYLWLTAASGQSFQDHANVRTNGLRYNQSNGVGIRTDTSYSGAPIDNQNAHTHLDRLQCKSGTQASAVYGTSYGSVLFKDLVLHSVNRAALHGVGTGSTLINILGFMESASTTDPGALQAYYNSTWIGCTAVRSSDRTPAGTGIYGSAGAVYISCASFGFTTPFAGASGPGSHHNGTDQSSGAGDNAQYSISYSQTSPFTDADKDSPPDLRPVSGTNLSANGSKDATNAPNDITGTARADPPTIGCWELVSAVTAKTATDSMAVIITESVRAETLLYGTDTLGVIASEGGTLLGAAATSDAVLVGVTESLIINGTAAVTDTLGAGLSDAVTLLSSVAVADTLPITLSPETAILVATLAAADSLAGVLAEVAVLLVSTTVTDSGAVVLTDDLIVDGTATPPESLAAGVSDAVTLDVTVDGVEALAVVLADAASYVDLFALTLVTAADTLAVVLGAEALALAVSLEPAESLPVVGTDDRIIDGTAALADTLPVGLSEDVIGDGSASPSETLGAGLGESALVTASLDAADTLAVVLVEFGYQYDVLVAVVEILGADSLAVVLATETAFTLVDLVALDTLPVGAATEQTVLLVSVTPDDAAALGLSDANLLIDGTADVAETLPAGLSEALIIVATLEPTDTLAVAGADELHLTYCYDATDTLPVGLSEVGTQDLAEEEIAKAGAIGTLPWNRRQWRVAPFRATIRRKF